ncbi:MAG TPA: efflux RND transporter periplasmic adaptor subunit [Acidobacteriaceae bacterium]|nr:efflux RND transporter periplasmic adaptor subunit [Acidobacteriaceae bacterium]
MANDTPVAAPVSVVQRGNISHLLSLAGQFQPYQVIDVHAKVSGYVRRINVDIGDRVHAGQTLAVLEVPELNAQYRGSQSEQQRSKEQIGIAQHEISRAEASHVALQANYDRLLQAFKAQPGLIAEQELDDARAKADASQAQVDVARSTLSAARQQSDVAQADMERYGALQSYTTITAPLSGVIIWRYADTGALIQAGTASDSQSLPLVKLSQSDLLRLRLPVPEDAVGYIHEGDTVQVRVDALHRSLTGKIVRFTRNVSLDTRTMQTEIDVPNKDLSIDPGMYANTYVRLAHKENVLTIPLLAVQRDDQPNGSSKNSVLVLDRQNRVERRPVELGIQGSLLAEVRSGLQENDRVVLGNAARYKDGEQVTPRVESRPANDVMHEEGGMTDAANDGGN